MTSASTIWKKKRVLAMVARRRRRRPRRVARCQRRRVVAMLPCGWQQTVVALLPCLAAEDLSLSPVVQRRWRDCGGPARPTRCRSWGAAPRVWRARVDWEMWGWQQTVVGHQLQMPIAMESPQQLRAALRGSLGERWVRPRGVPLRRGKIQVRLSAGLWRGPRGPSPLSNKKTLLCILK